MKAIIYHFTAIHRVPVFFTILTILTFSTILTIFDNWWQFSQFRQLLLPFWQLKRQSWRLVTFETLFTILTIEDLDSWQSLLLGNSCDVFPSTDRICFQSSLSLASRTVSQIFLCLMLFSGIPTWLYLLHMVRWPNSKAGKSQGKKCNRCHHASCPALLW